MKIQACFNLILFIVIAGFLSACDGDVVTLDDSTTMAATYIVEGSVTRLAGSGLVLKSNGGYNLSISTDDSTYATTIQTHLLAATSLKLWSKVLDDMSSEYYDMQFTQVVE